MNISFINTNKAPGGAVGPYSQGGVKADNLIFTSGQLPIIPETGGELLKDDIKKKRQDNAWKM